MHINELKINPKAEATIKVTDDFQFKCLTYIPAEKIADIVIDTVAPLFYTIQDGEIVVANILEDPTKDERFLLVNKQVYYAIALVKHLTDIEIPEDADISEVYNKLESYGILGTLLYKTDTLETYPIETVIDNTIQTRIEAINALKNK